MNKLTMKAIMAKLENEKTRDQVRLVVTQYLLAHPELLHTHPNLRKDTLLRQLTGTLKTTSTQKLATLFAAAANNTKSLKGFIDPITTQTELKLVIGGPDVEFISKRTGAVIKDKDLKIGFTGAHLHSDKRYADLLNTFVNLVEQGKGANVFKGAQALKAASIWSILTPYIFKIVEELEKEDFLYKTDFESSVVYIKPNKVFGAIKRAKDKAKELKNETTDQQIKDKLDKTIEKLEDVRKALNNLIHGDTSKAVESGKYQIDEDEVRPKEKEWNDVIDHLSDYVLENANEYSKIANILLEKEDEED